MNSLGRLMGRGFLCKILEPFSTNRRRIAFTSFSAFKFSPYLQQASPWTESTESRYKKGDLEVKVELDSLPLMLTADYTKREAKKQKRDQLQEKFGGIRKGVRVNLLELLFTRKRDYLVGYNGRQVKAEQLVGKIIVLYFVPLPHYSDHERMVTAYLIDAYNYILPNNGFEIVLVSHEVTDYTRCSDESKKINREKEFEDLISRMPWTAIPFWDTTSRNSLREKFGRTRHSIMPSTFVIDSTGMVLQTCSSIFNRYGGLGYPFSDGKIEHLKSEDDKAAKQLSVTTLLASPERDYVISNTGEKVLIHTLEEKVVALYFYEPPIGWFITELKMAYEELARNKENFEIVLIYLYDTEGTCNCTSEESFWRCFKTMPWLALPFRDPNYRKLKRFFSYPSDLEGPWEAPELVIIGPRGKFIEPWGANILRTFKLAAYPFTREKVAKLETEKVKELKFEILWDANTVFRAKNGTKVQLSELAGKRTILFFASERFLSECGGYHENEIDFLKTLKEKYVEMKDTDNEFEVIYISHSEKEFVYDEYVGDMPWLLSLTTELLPGDYCLYCCNCRYYWSSSSVLQYLPSLGHGYSSILAFDVDGMLVRKSLIRDPVPSLEDKIFPFNDGGMEEEIFFQLNKFDEWFIWDSYYTGLQINSFFKYDTIQS